MPLVVRVASADTDADAVPETVGEPDRVTVAVALVEGAVMMGSGLPGVSVAEAVSDWDGEAVADVDGVRDPVAVAEREGEEVTERVTVAGAAAD